MDGRLQQLISRGEGISLEFKRCGNQPGADVFETICSFANRQGGNLLLGVLDDGAVEGIPEPSALPIERNLVNVTCNPRLFNVAPAIECERLHCGEGRVVIRVWVPMGPSVYSYKGVVYDRRGDADVRLTGEADRAAMAVRKQSYYTERKVFPWVGESDLDLSLLKMLRDEVRANDPAHRWLSLDDTELLRDARLISRDPVSGDRGFNLAAVMLLGREETILDAAPVYRTDCVLRRLDAERYDDRFTCTANLMFAFDELVGWCERWLPDAFVLDGSRRVGARGVIVRELMSNTLIHREFVSPRIATVTIDRDGIRTRNASRALWSGPVDLENLDPTPKNPIIARVFTQMGRSEELGSGTRNLYRLSRLYSGADPVLVEGDCFEAFVPVPDIANGLGAGRASDAKTQDATHAEIRDAIVRLLERDGSFPASQLAHEVTSVGERTVRRYLAKMVDDGELRVIAGGRSTRYAAGDGSDA